MFALQACSEHALWPSCSSSHRSSTYHPFASAVPATSGTSGSVCHTAVCCKARRDVQCRRQMQGFVRANCICSGAHLSLLIEPRSESIGQICGFFPITSIRVNISRARTCPSCSTLGNLTYTQVTKIRSSGLYPWSELAGWSVSRVVSDSRFGYS